MHSCVSNFDKSVFSFGLEIILLCLLTLNFRNYVKINVRKSKSTLNSFEVIRKKNEGNSIQILNLQ